MDRKPMRIKISPFLVDRAHSSAAVWLSPGAGFHLEWHFVLVYFNANSDDFQYYTLVPSRASELWYSGNTHECKPWRQGDKRDVITDGNPAHECWNNIKLYQEGSPAVPRPSLPRACVGRLTGFHKPPESWRQYFDSIVQMDSLQIS